MRLIYLSITSILFLNNYCYAAISCITSYSPTRNVNMGDFDPYNYTNIVVPVTMTITCTSNSGNATVTYTYTFDGGSSGNMNARTMKNGSNIVNYGLCTTSNCLLNYGNGSSGTYSVNKTNVLINNTPKADTYNLYFVVPVQPLSTPGTYNDTINVSLTVSY